MAQNQDRIINMLLYTARLSCKGQLWWLLTFTYTMTQDILLWSTLRTWDVNIANNDTGYLFWSSLRRCDIHISLTVTWVILLRSFLRTCGIQLIYCHNSCNLFGSTLWTHTIHNTCFITRDILIRSTMRTRDIHNTY